MVRMKDRDFQLVKKSVDEKPAWIAVEVARGLIAHAEAIERELHEVVAKFGQSKRNVDRLTENVTQLQREREAMKVALPKEVAEAIECCKNAGLNSFGIITSMERVSSLFRDYSSPVLVALTVIRNFAWTVSGQRLLFSLVNDYTVEKTKEDRLREGIKKALVDLELFTENPMSKQIEHLTSIVTDFVTEFMAENS